MLRELTYEEAGFVSGGWAPAGQPGSGDELADQLARAREAMLAAWGIESWDGADDNGIDSDGFGDTIVVTAQTTSNAQAVGDSHYAIFGPDQTAVLYKWVWSNYVNGVPTWGYFINLGAQSYKVETTTGEVGITYGLNPLPGVSVTTTFGTTTYAWTPLN